ncbi:MAG: hypothetical protein HY675_26770 [Chloroflexi bacterium]|nr:hypothetical protein [Chloroflexota bacterium]
MEEDQPQEWDDWPGGTTPPGTLPGNQKYDVAVEVLLDWTVDTPVHVKKGDPKGVRRSVLVILVNKGTETAKVWEWVDARVLAPSVLRIPIEGCAARMTYDLERHSVARILFDLAPGESVGINYVLTIACPGKSGPPPVGSYGVEIRAEAVLLNHATRVIMSPRSTDRWY